MGACTAETSLVRNSKASATIDEPNATALNGSSSGILQNRLHTAFGSFQSISDRLSQSYIELENQVQELRHELLKADEDLERQQSAKKLLAEQLDLTVNLMPVAVLILDGKGVIRQANAFAAELLGCQLIGELWLQIIGRCFSPKPDDGHEVSLKNGRLVSIATQSLSSDAGQIIVLNDQTETRNLQARLNHNKKLSEMGKMTASLAHQIRTPLATASLYAERLSSPHLEQHNRVKYAGKIKQQLTHLEKQVQDMLVFSKAGIILNSVLSAGDLSKLLQQQSSEAARYRSVSICWDVQARCGSVRCNPDLLLSVVNNLMDNAIESCSNAGIKPSLRCCIKQHGHGFLQLAIEDNGPGIQAQNMRRIMEPFFTTKSSGTGLGLAVANAVIEAHGGCFSISNSKSGGAVAVVQLPLLEQKELEEK